MFPLDDAADHSAIRVSVTLPGGDHIKTTHYSSQLAAEETFARLVAQVRRNFLRHFSRRFSNAPDFVGFSGSKPDGFENPLSTELTR